MNCTLLLLARYHKSSPRQLKSKPLPSVRLRRALGLVILSKAPVDSVAAPREGLVRLLLLRMVAITRINRSSSVLADAYISWRPQAHSNLPYFSGIYGTVAGLVSFK